MPALDPMLNVAVLHMAALKFPRGYDVRPNAPDTLERLCAWLDSGKRMAVYDGGSDYTIFGDPQVNYAFRAWHDWQHWKYRLPFTPAGAAKACLLQINDLWVEYGPSRRMERWARIIDAEVNGQLQYAAAHANQFPNDQSAFVRAYLANPQAALAATY